jgi:hypothetical protein
MCWNGFMLQKKALWHVRTVSSTGFNLASTGFGSALTSLLAQVSLMLALNSCECPAQQQGHHGVSSRVITA